MVSWRLDEEDHRRVTEAVVEAERASAGEIVTIIAARSDSYHDVVVHYAVAAMLAVPALVALVPESWIARAEAAMLGWNAGFTRAAFGLTLFVLLALVFLLARFLLAPMRFRMALTPGATKARRVHRRAVELFRAGCELRTRGRTGVLIYLSVAEHRAEILADKAIAEKVDPDVWGEALADLIADSKDGRPGDGMVKAVRRVGEVLAGIIPPAEHDVNELSDRLVEL